MNARITLFVCALLSAAAAGCGEGEDGGSEQAALAHGHGEWEITIRTRVAGFETPPVVIRTCVNLQNPAPGFALTPAGVECDATRSLKGTTLAWKQDCGLGDIDWHTEGKVVYRGDTFDGRLVNEENGRQFSSAEISGIRLGGC